MKQNHEIRIKLSQEDLERIENKAEACSLSVSAYVRMVALKSQVEIQ
jgi:predicted DNA binding CopG/RHH family protein